MRYFVTFRGFGRKFAVLEFSTIRIPHKKAFEVVVFKNRTPLKRLCYQLHSTNEMIRKSGTACPASMGFL